MELLLVKLKFPQGKKVLIKSDNRQLLSSGEKVPGFSTP